MADRPRQIWVHALGAKAGGGLTYIRALFPEVARQLRGSDVRVVVLLPGSIDGIPLPDGIEVRFFPLASRNALTRIVFDQVILPLWLKVNPGAVLYCSGSFSPLLNTAPTVTLVRNAIYFDPEFLRRERPLRRLRLRIQGLLIARGAAASSAVHYPSAAMRSLVEVRYPQLRATGVVNHFGIGEPFLTSRSCTGSDPKPAGAGPLRFLYVMNYTLQKNLGVLLQALALARHARLGVSVTVTSWLCHGPRASFSQDRRIIEANDLIGSGYLALVGPQFGDALVAQYRLADGCIFLSICESFGHPLVEALAMGKPLICADRPYAREICGEHALYVDPDRPEALVEVWRDWPRFAQRLRVASPDAVSQRFSWPRHVSRILQGLLAFDSRVAPAES